MFQGAKFLGPWHFRSRERKFLGAKVPVSAFYTFGIPSLWSPCRLGSGFLVFESRERLGLGLEQHLVMRKLLEVD